MAKISAAEATPKISDKPILEAKETEPCSCPPLTQAASRADGAAIRGKTKGKMT